MPKNSDSSFWQLISCSFKAAVPGSFWAANSPKRRIYCRPHSDAVRSRRNNMSIRVYIYIHTLIHRVCVYIYVLLCGYGSLLAIRKISQSLIEVIQFNRDLPHQSQGYASLTTNLAKSKSTVFRGCIFSSRRVFAESDRKSNGRQYWVFILIVLSRITRNATPRVEVPNIYALLSEIPLRVQLWNQKPQILGTWTLWARKWYQ